MWIIKAGAILLTGQQPPVVFEAAMPLFAVGLLGLHARLEGRGGSLGKAGVLVAYAALASAAIVLMAPLAPFIAVAGFGPFLGLVLLGSATLHAGIFPPPWIVLPLAMGLGGSLLIPTSYWRPKVTALGLLSSHPLRLASSCSRSAWYSERTSLPSSHSM